MKKKTLLLVDDNESIIYTVKRCLDQNEFEITSVLNGKDALSYLEKHIPDLILLDLMMPKMDGWEVHKKIKENNQHKGIPIIFLTALGEKDGKVVKIFENIRKSTSDVDSLTHVSVNDSDYIQKPFDPQELRDKIHTLLK